MTLVLRFNQEICVSRLFVHGVDRTQRHQTSRSSDHRVPDLCDHLRYYTPGLLLLPRSSLLPVIPHLPPAHHETSKHDSLNESKRNKDKVKTIKIVPDSNSNPVRAMTHHNQTKELTTWFLNYVMFTTVTQVKKSTLLVFSCTV
jgi:hypothetical protein